MTRQQLAQYLRSQLPTDPRSDEELTTTWLSNNPTFKVDDAQPPSKGEFSPVALGLRVVPAMFGAEGFLPGAALSGGGEALAQLWERFTQGEDIRPSKIAAAAAIGAIPVGGAISRTGGALKAITGQAIKGAGIGAASSAIEDLVGEGKAPDIKKAALTAGAGGVLGGATEAMMPTIQKLIGRFKAENPSMTTAATEATKAVQPGDISPTIEREVLQQNPLKPPERNLKFGNREEVPPQGAISDARLLQFPSIQKMPEEVQGDILKLLEAHGGFEAQRRGVQSFDRTNALAQQVTVPLEQLKPGTALNAEELAAYRDAVASIMSQRIPLAQKVAAGSATDIEKLQLQKLTEEGTALVASYRGAKAEAGRSLSILRGQARVLQFGDEAFIEAALKAPGFQQNAEAIAKAVTEAGGDPLKQLETLRTNARTWGGMAQSAYYNSLLSGVKTHLRNIIGNTFNMASNLTNPLVAGPVDALKSRITGSEREVFTGEFGQQLVGTMAALKTASRNALFTLKHGFTPETVAEAFVGKFDTPSPELPGGMVTNWPSRLLYAADQFFRSLAENQELFAGAYAMARKGGAQTPEAIQKRMIDIIGGTGPESLQLFKQATNFGARAVFQEKPGAITNSLLRMKATAPPGIREALTFIMPFVKTPGNIIRQGLEASPVGLPIFGKYSMKAASQGGREGAQALGRAVGGSMALMPFALLAIEGRLSGNGPQDAGERAALYESGWQPNSVKVGDKWVRFQLFQPFSVALAAVANAWDRYTQSDKSDASAESSFTQAVAASGASILNQSFLAGINGFLDAISDPERAGARYMGLAAQGMVPGSGLLRNITQAVDPVVRKPEGIGESIKAITPGLSTEVPARLTRFGEPVTRPGGPIRRGFVVPEVSEEVHDPVAELLQRVGSTPEVPRAKMVRKGEEVQLSREQKQTMEEAVGRERRALLERVLQKSNVDKEDVDRLLREATQNVYRNSYRKVKSKEPFNVEQVAPMYRRKLNKSQVDEMYKAYLENQKQ